MLGGVAGGARARARGGVAAGQLPPAFSCLGWNANGLAPPKTADLAAHLTEVGTGVDALVLVETHRVLSGDVLPGYRTCAALQAPLLSSR